MRWIGAAQRSFEMMCAYALKRQSFGEPLAKKQTVQNWIADSAAEINAARLMTLNAAWKLDRGDDARIAFYETFARFKVAVVIQQIYFRYVQGQTRDERFRNFDGLVRELTTEALELAEQSGI